MTDSTRTALDRVGALARLPRGFHALDGMRKVDAILSLDDPESFVHGLSADVLFLLLHDIGVTDCLELVALTTPEQRLVFADIDCWRGESFQPDRFDEWLDLLTAADHDVVVETVGQADPELLVSYVLEKVVTIFDRTEEDSIQEHEQIYNLLYTPDRDFVLVLPPEATEGDEAVKNLGRLIDLLYRFDPVFARAIVMSARIGLPTENVELAAHFRRGRLADLGFPEPGDAHELYAPIRVETVRAQIEAQPRPSVPEFGERLAWGLVRRPSREMAFLDACLERAEQVERIGRDIGYCVNRAVVASPEGILLRNVERVQSIADRVRATIGLGLEYLADGEVEVGARLLDAAWAMQLFQTGHALAADLRRRGRALQSRARGLLPQALEPTLEALEGHPQPQLALADGRTQPFRSLAQIHQVGGLLGRQEELCDAFERAFGFTLEQYERHDFTGIGEDDRLFITLETLARTLLAHVAAGRDPSFEPLDPSDLPSVLSRLHELPALAKDLATRVGQGADRVLPAAAASLVEALQGLPLDGPLDGRFLSGGLLLVRGLAETGT